MKPVNVDFWRTVKLFRTTGTLPAGVGAKRATGKSQDPVVSIHNKVKSFPLRRLVRKCDTPTLMHACQAEAVCTIFDSPWCNSIAA